MAAVDRETQRLRELHEFYVWQVNAAVAEGRDDLVAELADQYLEDAMAELTASSPDAHAPESRPTGARTEELAVGPPEPRRPWWRRLRPR